MGAKWLFKSDPDTYSFADLERDRRTVWDGVSNNLALKHLRSVRRGDQALIYHTGDERAVVGLAEVVSDAYADPKQKDPRLVMVQAAKPHDFALSAQRRDRKSVAHSLPKSG